MPKDGISSCPYFTVFRPKTKVFFVNVLIQSEFGKTQARENSVFSRNVNFISIHILLSTTKMK